jgi:5,10-methylenetetrahydromethanopterin reductase
MAVGRVAEATSLRLGTAVAVPSVRHPMVTASAIATVEDFAPGRLTVAFGTGFSARKAMGRPPMRWADLAEYVCQVGALLAGEVVDIDGKACQMLHPVGYAPARPITTRLLVAPSGPKGYAVARELGSGVMLTGVPDVVEHDWPFSAIITSGTVVRLGEDHTSERLVQAVAPWFGTGYHALWEFAPDALDTMPGGSEWRDAMLAARPERERHLAVHEGHVTVLADRDLAAVRAAGARILQHGWTGDAAAVRRRFVAAGDAGIDEVVYCAAGPDIEGELRAFADAVR